MPQKNKKVYIKTFGCIQNTADSERIKAYYWEKGFKFVNDWRDADEVVINTCVIRESAENRVYGLIDKINKSNLKIKVVVTGCLVGVYKNQKKIKELDRRIEGVDEWAAIEKYIEENSPLRSQKTAALIPISFGCNNFCSYCIVPMSRGKEVSKPMEEILAEVDKAIENGFDSVVLIGQNVNSYGAELEHGQVVSMGKKRFKSLFPKLLESVAQKQLKKISFVSSNPWDFSDELIEVIANNKNIDRLLHLPFQSGNDEILKKMNRGYTKSEYLELVNKIKRAIGDVRFSTDIIIGFPGETDEAFDDTVEVCKQVGFEIAYLNKYSPRPGTVSAKMFDNDISQAIKKQRWTVLNELVNNKNGKKLV